MTIRKFINIRVNGETTTWKDLAKRYDVAQYRVYDRAIKSGLESMKINDDIITWTIQEWTQYFIVEGKKIENANDLAKHCRVHSSTVFSQMQRNPVNFLLNGISVKRIKVQKNVKLKTGELDGSTIFQDQNARPLFKYDVIECGGHQLVRKLYIGGRDSVLSHTYGYEQGKQYLTL